MNERATRPLPPHGVDGHFIWARGGNAGDDLIRRACLKFLHAEGLQIWESDGQIEAAALAGDDAYLDRALAGFPGFIFFTGGGNIGLYPENRLVRTRVSGRARNTRGILVFSQSARAVEDSLRSELVTVWTRDRASRDLLHTGGVKTVLVPDCAFNLDREFPKAPSGAGIFQILREPGRDDERVLHGLRLPDAPAGDVTFELPIDEVVSTLLPRRVVVSDRLHGAIVSLMLRKRTALLPIGYHKNRSFFDTWLSVDPGVAFVDNQRDLERFIEGDQTPSMDFEDLFLRHARPALRSFLDESSRRADRRPTARPTRTSPVSRMEPRLVSITGVRNEGDIIEAFVRHTAAYVDQMILLDNGSSDDTRHIVDQLKQEGLPLVLDSDDSFGYWQSDRLSALMRRAATAHDADWVLPLDADEFLVTRDRAWLRNQLHGRSAPAYVQWQTYVPRPSDNPLDANPATRIQQRASDETPWYKVFVPRPVAEDPSAVLQQGSHDVSPTGSGPFADTVLDGVRLAHLPVRTGAQFATKVAIAHLQLLAMHERDPSWNAHTRRFYDLLKSDEVQFQASYTDFALHYAPRPDERREVSLVNAPVPYAGTPLRYTSGTLPTPFRLVLDYAEQLAASYAVLSREFGNHRSTVETALDACETELTNTKKERAYQVAAWVRALWHLTRSIARADFADARRRLGLLRRVSRR